ncbi:hypothetical protein [Lysinibacillus sp. 54212]|uniref:hypothetical protein n=1 Tax=Lysinibacillus sp. 54212 TaxID=3119829 RepID=UPI002FCB5D96
MKVDRVTTTPDAYKQQQYYAGTHLAYYYNPTANRPRARVDTEVECGIFTRYLEKENGQRDMLTTSSTKEKMFLEKRIAHAEREELMQRLNYKNGVHYSAANKIYLQMHT